MARKPLNILSIDDDAATQQELVAYLQQDNHTVTTCRDGEEGLKLFRDNQPDMVLCDINMHDKKGHDLLSIIHQESPEIPFIVVSAASSIHDAVNALREGAWDYIIKPVSDLGSLTHSIRKCLERKQLIFENERYKCSLEKANEELSKNLATLEEDVEAGRCVQFQLLPEKNIRFNQLTCDHYIMPSLYLSGDFVDYFPIDEHKTGFYIADVSGHGAPSAFITVLLKSLVNHFVVRYGANTNDMIINPAKLLNWLSLDILRAKLGKYLTIIYGVIDDQNNQLTYSIGGHFPNPVLVIDGDAQYLPGSGFPIGVFEKAQYENYTVDLPDQFHLMMFSDGILELLPHSNLEAKEAYLKSLVATPKANIRLILDDIKIDTYKAIPDDITLLHLQKGY